MKATMIRGVVSVDREIESVLQPPKILAEKLCLFLIKGKEYHYVTQSGKLLLDGEEYWFQITEL